MVTSGHSLCQFNAVRTFAAIAILFCVSIADSFGAIQVGAESAVTLPTAAHYSGIMNVRPGNGETVSNNPPIFSWFYMTNHVAGGEQNPGGAYPNVFNQTNDFQLQVSSNATFNTTLLVDVHTAHNFYNFLGPLSTNASRQIWWRVKYWTNGGPYWTNGPYTFSFPAQVGAVTNWDRSMFADAGYHTTNSVHPIFAFRAGEEAGIWAWITSSTNENEYRTLTNRATACTNSGYFKGGTNWPVNATANPNFATVNPADAFTRCNDLGAVLLLNVMSGDTRWNNAQMTTWLKSNLNIVATWHNHRSNNWAWADYGQPAGSPNLIRLIAAGYDWLYDSLGSDTGTQGGITRTNLEWALKTAVRFWNHNNLYSASRTVTGQLVLTNGYDHYLNSEQVVPWSSWAKLPHSHITMDTHVILPAMVVLQQDATDGAFAFDWMMNFMLARTTPFAGFAAHHVGPYGYTDTHIYDRMLFSGLMVLDVAYPQSQLYRTDFCRRFPEWYTRMLPYGMRKNHGAYGDGAPFGWASYLLADKRRGWDMAAVSRSGLAMQAYDLNREFSNTVSDTSGAHWDLLPLRYHYRTTPAPETNTPSALYAEDGYVIAGSKSPSEFDYYTNGAGFSFQARPRGSMGGHMIPSDLSVDLWAYGQNLTDGGGASLDDYSRFSAAASPTLLVNGYGYGAIDAALGYGDLYSLSPTAPVVASITHYTNFSGGVYARAEGAGLFTNSYHPLRWLVTKLNRHVLFMTNRNYWVIYDEFGTTSNATVAFRWHVPWPIRYAAASSPLANETAFSGDRYGSNSYVRTADGFTYSAGHYEDANSTGPQLPRIPVHVFFANDPSTVGAFAAVGTGSLGSSDSGVIGTSATNSTLNPFLDRTYATLNPDRAVGFFLTNKVAATNGTFLTVIVPQRTGASAPTFERLADNSVRVTYDGAADTITFPASGSLVTINADATPAPMRIRLRPRLQGKKNLADPWHDKTNQLADVELDSEQAQFYRVKMESERIRP